MPPVSRCRGPVPVVIDVEVTFVDRQHPAKRARPWGEADATDLRENGAPQPRR